MDAFFLLHLILASLYIWLAVPNFRINPTTFAPLVMLAAYTNFLLAIPLGIQSHIANQLYSGKSKPDQYNLRHHLFETIAVLVVSIAAWLLPFGIGTVAALAITFPPALPIFALLLAMAVGVYHYRAKYHISIKALTSIFLIYFMLAGRIPWQESPWSIAAVTTAVSAGILLLSRFLPSVRATLSLPNVKAFMVLNFLVLVPIVGPVILVVLHLLASRRQSEAPDALSETLSLEDAASSSSAEAVTDLYTSDKSAAKKAAAR